MLTTSHREKGSVLVFEWMPFCVLYLRLRRNVV